MGFWDGMRVFAVSERTDTVGQVSRNRNSWVVHATRETGGDRDRRNGVGAIIRGIDLTPCFTIAPFLHSGQRVFPSCSSGKMGADSSFWGSSADSEGTPRS